MADLERLADVAEQGADVADNDAFGSRFRSASGPAKAEAAQIAADVARFLAEHGAGAVERLPPGATNWKAEARRTRTRDDMKVAREEAEIARRATRLSYAVPDLRDSEVLPRKTYKKKR